MRLLLPALILFVATTAVAKPTSKKIAYDLDGTKFESVVIYDAGGKPKPALLLVPNWLGINAATLRQAELVASRGYTVFVADVYGAANRPTGPAAAGKLAGGLKGDRATLRKRVVKALDVFRAQKGLPADFKKVGAIGFCFGGTTVLELARSGAQVAGIVSFHGGLSTPTPGDAKNIKAHVLALHGADDPSVPPTEVAAFEAEMRAAKVDWQLVAFGNTFTDPDANTAGTAAYNPIAAARSYALMDAFFAEVFR